jgi:hypothetical protein
MLNRFVMFTVESLAEHLTMNMMKLLGLLLFCMLRTNSYLLERLIRGISEDARLDSFELTNDYLAIPQIIPTPLILSNERV